MSSTQFLLRFYSTNYNTCVLDMMCIGKYYTYTHVNKIQFNNFLNRRQVWFALILQE